jgi:hypothetical protein
MADQGHESAAARADAARHDLEEIKEFVDELYDLDDEQLARHASRLARIKDDLVAIMDSPSQSDGSDVVDYASAGQVGSEEQMQDEGFGFEQASVEESVVEEVGQEHPGPRAQSEA